MRFTLLSLLLLAGCTRENPSVKAAEQAEQRLQIVIQSHGSPSEKCAAEREVERAWLTALDRDKYQQAKIAADVDCS